tara:strand:+ start:3004 stop:4965 length:1962 start_codon:yes stop_codon:yes gene_type:complete
MTTSAMQDKVFEVLSKRELSEVVEQLRPNSVFSIDAMRDDLLDIYSECKTPKEFLDIVKHAVFSILTQKHGSSVNIPITYKDLSVRLIANEILNMHEISSDYENTVITFDTVIIATDSPKTFVKKAKVVCPLCYNDDRISCDYNRDLPIIFCDNTRCKRQKMKIDTTSVITDDIQTVLMQELMENTKNNSPIILTGKLTGKNVGTSFVGQKKRITGIFKTVIDDKKNEHDITIEVLSLEDLEDVSPRLPSPEQIKKLHEDSKSDNFISDIVNSFSPQTYGNKNIKLSILCLMAGGVAGQKRGDINILLAGDPSMAKSVMLIEADKITHKSMYTSGRGASAAGLTIGMVKISDGRMLALAGVLPLMNGGVAYIDEFDKMNKDDRSAIHPAMEQQKVTIAKAGTTLTLPAKTSILAAANPKFGRFDGSQTLTDNIDIPPPLLSRFDLIWVIKDEVNLAEDLAKANHVLDTFENNNVDVKAKYTREELTEYINYVKTKTPKLSPLVRKKIITIYEKMRALAVQDDVVVGIRQLEALVRLSSAYAKLKLKDIVDDECVDEVQVMLEDAFKRINPSFGSSGYQAQLQGVSSRLSKEQLAFNIWAECEDENGHVNLIKFFKRMEEGGFKQQESKRIFTQWETNCIIILNDDGTYKRSRT